MTENNKIDFETIDYSKVNPKKLNGNKCIVKSYLIYFAMFAYGYSSIGRYVYMTFR